MSIRCGHCQERHESVAEVRACGARRPVQVSQEDPLEPGFYRSGPKVFRLHENGAWGLLMSNGRFSGPARPPYRPERMTVEEVASEGRRLVRCIVCGIKLTKPASIERGMGDICASKV